MSRLCVRIKKAWMAGLRRPWRVLASSGAGPPPGGCGTSQSQWRRDSRSNDSGYRHTVAAAQRCG